MLSTSRFTATLIVLVLAQLAVAQSLNLFPRTIAIVFGLAAIVRGSGLLHVFLVPFGFTEIAGLGAALSWIPIVGRHPPPPLLGRLARGGGAGQGAGPDLLAAARRGPAHARRQRRSRSASRA